VWIDKLRLERILANLLDNARQHGGGPQRISIEPGKGRNLLAAWRLCLDAGIDAVVGFDGDMTTVQPWWVEAFVRPIAARGVEFVSPLYRRNLYRAVTARNVSRGFLYAWFGVDVQHPLSGNAALARPLLERLAARDWTPAQLRYGVETAVVSTLLADRRPWTTAQLDICKDNVHFGHRTQILRDALIATVEAAREFAPRPGLGGPAVTAPMTFIEGAVPETGWLEAFVARAREDYSRWQGSRIGEIEAALDAGRLDASLWFRVFARALLEARGHGRDRAADSYAAALAPLLALRALTVWREVEDQPAEAIDAATSAEVPMMRSAVAAAEDWARPPGDTDIARRAARCVSTASVK
jgi:hypothetical protein